MKRLLITAIAVCMALTAGAQREDDKPETIFGEMKLKGGHVGVSAQYFDLKGEAAFGVGGEAALNFGRKLNIGFAGQVVATDAFSNYMDVNGNPYFWEMGYGGLFIEPVLFGNSKVHFAFPCTLGAGVVALGEHRVYDWQWDYDSSIASADYFMIGQFGANVELNLFRFMRLAGGINYRLTSDVYLQGDKTNMSGLGGNITLKLGWF